MALAYICVGGGESSLDSGGAEEEERGECMRPERSAGEEGGRESLEAMCG